MVFGNHMCRRNQTQETSPRQARTFAGNNQSSHRQLIKIRVEIRKKRYKLFQKRYPEKQNPIKKASPFKP